MFMSLTRQPARIGVSSIKKKFTVAGFTKAARELRRAWYRKITSLNAKEMKAKGRD
jgi:hypothetical protein